MTVPEPRNSHSYFNHSSEKGWQEADSWKSPLEKGVWQLGSLITEAKQDFVCRGERITSWVQWLWPLGHEVKSLLLLAGCGASEERGWAHIIDSGYRELELRKGGKNPPERKQKALHEGLRSRSSCTKWASLQLSWQENWKLSEVWWWRQWDLSPQVFIVVCELLSWERGWREKGESGTDPCQRVCGTKQAASRPRVALRQSVAMFLSNPVMKEKPQLTAFPL